MTSDAMDRQGIPERSNTRRIVNVPWLPVFGPAQASVWPTVAGSSFRSFCAAEERASASSFVSIGPLYPRNRLSCACAAEHKPVALAANAATRKALALSPQRILFRIANGLLALLKF